MGFKDSIAFVKKLWIPLFLFLLITPNKLIAQPATLELHRIWGIDLDQDVTALRLADLDGDGTNEIFVGLWDGDSGYIEVFSGFNGIFIQTSEKIPAHKIIDLDIGDIDGDQDLEVVVGADTTTYDPYHFWGEPWIYVFDIAELRLDWQKRIEGEVKSIEVEDIDKDDTAEVFIGTYLYDQDYGSYNGHEWFYFAHGGVLYRLKGATQDTIRMDYGYGYWKLVAYDIDQDSYNEIVCGTYEAYYYYEGPHVIDFSESSARIQVIDQDKSLSQVSEVPSYYNGFDTPYMKSMAIGNCDSDDYKEIVSYIDIGWWYFGTPHLLSVSDACSCIVENSFYYPGIVENSFHYPPDIVALALFDIDDQTRDEILIAHSSGIIEAVDGMTFDTIAISDPLPPISFFAFGDVTEDAMPEICISDGDSLFLYGFGPTAVEEENEEDLASKFVLQQNFPNPFNPQTTIKYYLPKSSKVVLNIYNIMGQRVKTLVDGFQSVGYQSVTWDGTDKNGREVASGIYFYRVKTDYSQETKKMILLK
jgi:hypothetical protein